MLDREPRGQTEGWKKVEAQAALLQAAEPQNTVGFSSFSVVALGKFLKQQRKIKDCVYLFGDAIRPEKRCTGKCGCGSANGRWKTGGLQLLNGMD